MNIKRRLIIGISYVHDIATVSFIWRSVDIAHVSHSDVHVYD